MVKGVRLPEDRRVKTIAVDFDGVIHAYSRGYLDGSIYDEPADGAIDALRELMEDYAVFIFTARDVLSVAAWLHERGFRVVTENPTEPVWKIQGILLVTQTKYVAEIYIDDRGLRFEDWDQTLADVKRLVKS